MTLPDRPFVRVTAGEFQGMTGVLCGGSAGNWLVYLTCHGTYQTVEAIEVEQPRPPISADEARRERAA